MIRRLLPYFFILQLITYINVVPRAAAAAAMYPLLSSSLDDPSTIRTPPRALLDSPDGGGSSTTSATLYWTTIVSFTTSSTRPTSTIPPDTTYYNISLSTTHYTTFLDTTSHDYKSGIKYTTSSPDPTDYTSAIGHNPTATDAEPTSAPTDVPPDYGESQGIQGFSSGAKISIPLAIGSILTLGIFIMFRIRKWRKSRLPQTEAEIDMPRGGVTTTGGAMGSTDILTEGVSASGDSIDLGSKVSRRSTL